MTWKTVRETIECKKCEGTEFKKVIIEKVTIKSVNNYTKDGKFTGGMWDEKTIDEHKVTYTCLKCGTEIGEKSK